jgi:hypothetical protein
MKKLLGFLSLIAIMTTVFTATASAETRTEIVYSTSVPIEKLIVVETSSESFLVSEIEIETLFSNFKDTSTLEGDVGWNEEINYNYKTKDSSNTEGHKEVGWSKSAFKYRFSKRSSRYSETSHSISDSGGTTRSRNRITNTLASGLTQSVNGSISRAMSCIKIW